MAASGRPEAMLQAPPLTVLVVAGGPVGQPVDLGGGRQHEGEAHEQGGVLGQRAVGLRRLAGRGGEVRAAAGGVAHADPLSCRAETTGGQRSDVVPIKVLRMLKSNTWTLISAELK